MGYFNNFIKPLLALLLVLALHALVLWQVMQYTPEKRLVEPPKPIMVSLITPPKPPVKAPILLPVAKKTLVKKTEPKIVAKPKRKRAKKAKQKLAKKVAARSQQSTTSTPTKIATSSSHSYQVGQNSNKSGQENQASSRRQAGGATTTPSYNAAYLHNPRPPYPRISRRRGEQGQVFLQVKVTKNGRATSVMIKRSSGSSRLDKAARQTVNKWRFIPAKKNGNPVNGWVIVPIVFKLN